VGFKTPEYNMTDLLKNSAELVGDTRKDGDKMIKQHKMRLGAGVAVLALVSMACTCGSLTSGLGQAQGSLQTAEALATGIATSGVVATVQAIATSDAATEAAGGNSTDATPADDSTPTGVGGGVNIGGAPDNIPVYDGAENLVSASGTVAYQVSADLKSVEDFYKSNMTDKGWTESQAPVELGGQIATLTYTNDTQQAVVAITSAGGQTQVAVAITNK
jgi:hypothetical protein